MVQKSKQVGQNPGQPSLCSPSRILQPGEDAFEATALRTAKKNAHGKPLSLIAQ